MADDATVRRAIQGLAVATLGLAIWSAFAFPTTAPLPQGWFTPILAFEFARTPADLDFLRGPDGAVVREAMRAGQRVDRFFPFAYGGLLLASALSTRRRVWAGLGSLAALVATAFDLVENRVLGHILEHLERGEQAAQWLDALFITTWTKWGAIGVGLSAIGWALRDTERKTALVLIGSAVLVPVACVSGMPLLAELVGLGVVAGFLALALRVRPKTRDSLDS